METLRLRVYRILCLMMALMILISAAVLPPARAVVLADDLIAAGAVGIVAAIWIASGAEFVSTDDLWRACQHVYDNYISNVPELLSEVTQLAKQWAWTWGGSIGKVGVLVSSRLWEAVCGSPSSDIGSTISSGVSYSFNSRDDFITVFPNGTPYYNKITLNNQTVTMGTPYLKNQFGDIFYIVPYTFYDSNTNTTKKGDYWFEEESYLNPNCFYGLKCYSTSDSPQYINIRRDYYVSDGVISSGYFDSCSYPASLTLYDVLSIGGTIAEPQDIAVTLPQATPGYDDEGKVVYPDIPLDAPSYRTNTADIPTDAALPTDTVIDLSTGAEITDVTDVPDVPATGELPSASDLTLPDLIISKFPFCIPFDVYNMFALLAADPVEPVFVIPVQIGSLVDESITIDFSQFSQIIAIVRWGEYACFVAGLALVTRNYIKW